MGLYVDIQKRLGDFQLQVNLTAERERLALLGASGCGKSVTLRCVAGILTPDAGCIRLDGRTLYDSAAHIDLPPQKRHVGYLFQQYALFPHMTVRQNVATAAKGRGGAQEADRLLRRFQLEEVAGQRPWQLSGGQQQRTALARILASEPEVLLLDEPFSALDSYLKYQLELELAQTLDEFPGPVLWVSHDRGEVFRNCQRVCVIDRGQSHSVQTIDELFQNPETEAAARLSGCKNYANAVPRGDAVFLPEWGVTLACGRTVPDTINRFGIRAHHVHPAASNTPNSFPCTVTRVIADVFSTIVLLRPDGSPPSAPLLRMELDKDAWEAVPDKVNLTVAVRPENILLLRGSGQEAAQPGKPRP